MPTWWNNIKKAWHQLQQSPYENKKELYFESIHPRIKRIMDRYLAPEKYNFNDWPAHEQVEVSLSVLESWIKMHMGEALHVPHYTMNIVNSKRKWIRIYKAYKEEIEEIESRRDKILYAIQLFRDLYNGNVILNETILNHLDVLLKNHILPGIPITDGMPLLPMPFIDHALREYETGQRYIDSNDIDWLSAWFRPKSYGPDIWSKWYEATMMKHDFYFRDGYDPGHKIYKIVESYRYFDIETIAAEFNQHSPLREEIKAVCMFDKCRRPFKIDSRVAQLVKNDASIPKSYHGAVGYYCSAGHALEDRKIGMKELKRQFDLFLKYAEQFESMNQFVETLLSNPAAYGKEFETVEDRTIWIPGLYIFLVNPGYWTPAGGPTRPFKITPTYKFKNGIEELQTFLKEDYHDAHFRRLSNYNPIVLYDALILDVAHLYYIYRQNKETLDFIEAQQKKTLVAINK